MEQSQLLNIITKSILKILTESSRNNPKTVGIRKHVGISCDYCGAEDFEGDRYFCTICSDYDLCAKCFCAALYNKQHEVTHPALCITNPIEGEDERTFRENCKMETLVNHFSAKEHQDVSCKHCKKDLIGVRLKCESCYNYDMCYPCWKANGHKNHPLIVYTSDVIEKVSIDKIEIENLLGGGCFGNVYKAYLLPERTVVACKTVESYKNSPEKMDLDDCVQSLIREINAHLEIRSAFICKLFGYSIDINLKGFKICVLMEFMYYGTLTSVIEKEKKGEIAVPYVRKMKLMGDVACALYDIHRKNYIHADLKPDNVLISHDYVAKISDFGIVKNRNVYENNPVGSVQYMPLEFSTGNYDKTVDLYSYGLVMYHFFCGMPHQLASNGLPYLNNFNLIKLPVIKELILYSTSVYPTMRRDAAFYLVSLRYLTTIFDKILDYAGGVESYKEMSANEKDSLFLSLYNSITPICSYKMANIGKAYYHMVDFSKSLNSPDIDTMIRQVSNTLNFPKAQVPEIKKNDATEPINIVNKTESTNQGTEEKLQQAPITTNQPLNTTNNKNVTSKACCIS